MKRHLQSVVVLLFCLLGTSAKASHFYGADLNYTHVSGNTYTITFTVYADCNLSNPPFLSLPSATPEIEIWDGTTQINSIILAIQSPSSGTEVTPVCATQLNNTTCVSTTGTIPGVKKFVYTGTVSLGWTSTNWRFLFNGIMGSSQAGRSNTITNIQIPAMSGSLMGLEATLNNSGGPNSSPTYTTIPTPFFCINKAASYNPGTVDANNDALTYSLVPGIEVTTSSTVTYLTGYSATAPLAAATGTFNFNTTNGQLNFTPNLVQRSLVVTKVSEFRGSTLVGTSMREMTFVVLNNCNNNPPGGGISNVSGGTLVNSTTVSVCQGQGSFAFSINPTDLDGNSINVSASGIPTGASFTITNNNTIAPIGSFSWNLVGVTPGTYNFFITYTDDGCPLSSKQTQAYTINVLPQPKITFGLVSAATCTKKAKFNVTPSIAPSPWVLTVLQGTTTVHTITGITATQLDSLDPGTYTLRISSTNTCIKDTTITIAPPPVIIPSVSMVKPICFGGNDGSITITASGGLAPFQYAIGAGTFSSTNTFTGLAAGTYTLHIKDANDCLKDTTVQLLDPLAITAAVTFTSPPCNFYNSGVITVTANNGTAPYQYALNTGSFSTTNTFTGLYSGNYTLHIKDANNCLKDTIVNLPDSIAVHATAVLTHILCHGDSTGAITITANSATPPYLYKLGGGTLGTTNTFPNLWAGNHTIHIEDSNKCYLDTIITLNEPTAITSTSVVTNVSCFGLSDGSVTITAAGGTSPYNYALGAGPYGSTGVFGGLAAGSYTIHIKDANGCLKDTTITVTQPAVLAFNNIAKQEPNCFSFSDGSITITAAGGTTPYTYAIDAGLFNSSNVFSSLAAGTYVLHIKDDHGCAVDSTVTLTQPPAVQAFAQVTNSVCATLSNGKVVLSATGGVPPYQYAVGLGAYSSTPTFTGLAAGTYFFHIRDSRNCQKDTGITIIDSFVLKMTASVTNVSCFGDSTGSITVTASGGTSPYTYAKGIFGTYNSSNVFPTLKALTYLIKIKDANGCIKDSNIAVTEPPILKAFITPQNVSCFGFNDGKITVNGTGGTTPYSYAMGAGTFGSLNLFQTLPIGTYLVHVKDGKGCMFDTSIILTQPPAMGIALSVADVLCFGDSTGQVTVTGSGGVLPYDYRWDYGVYQVSNILTKINSGPHVIRVRDANGCFKDSNIVVNQPTKLEITELTIVHPTCEGFTDGRITIAAAGGITPYQYAAGGNTFTGSAAKTNLGAGSQVVQVKDNNGCIKDTVVVLTGYPAIILDEITPKDVSCFGMQDGTIEVSAHGGVQPLAYSIGSMIPDEKIFRNLKPSSYTVTVTDSKNCTKDTTVSVGSPDKIVIALTANKNDCEGFDDGGAIVSKVIGGTLPYNYAWNTKPERFSADLTGVANGTYRLAIIDANDCTDTAEATILYDNCCKPFIPDAFTPNNDGKNDKARILFKGDMTLKIFSIFNRFGEVVFTTANINDGWDGIYNGEPQDIGTYNYYVKAICGNGGNNEVEYKGTITLIR
ncbi:gliding motility-associated C-terminal domain-containing protein [Polluticoccus soli]|uniref:T9SS type B sorting domain-containing protein n=1 Tax=Polluticoccus soli TaxID=3034150 RepID=UPI0023E2F1AD|nr:gliding motility-associated C-terminal domain-containing protein [Flavipsychrobacter sp. JY13-12]